MSKENGADVGGFPVCRNLERAANPHTWRDSRNFRDNEGSKTELRILAYLYTLIGKNTVQDRGEYMACLKTAIDEASADIDINDLALQPPWKFPVQGPLQLEIICNPWDKDPFDAFMVDLKKAVVALAQRIHGVDGAEDVFYVGSVRRVYEATCRKLRAALGEGLQRGAGGRWESNLFNSR